MKKIKIIIIIIAVVLCGILIAAAHPMAFWKKPLVEDTNVQSIPIMTTIKQSDSTFTIDRLEIGDKYSTIYYAMSPEINGESLKGASLLQNGVALDIVNDVYSGKLGGAVCFNTTDSLENLTFVIAQIDDYTITNFDFELKFIDNICLFDVVVDDCKGTIEVELCEDGIGIVTKDIQNLNNDGKKTRTKIPNNYLFYNVETGENGIYMFNAANPPTHIRLIDKVYIVESQSLEIPIS